MALMITKDSNTGERTRTLGVDRSTAVAAVVDQRKVPPIEKSGQAPAPDAPSATEPAAEPVVPPAEAKQDPAHLVEIERRERALDAARHEHELTKRELDRFKSSPEEALRAAGFTPETFVQRWLGDDKAAAQPEAKPEAPESELAKRLQALESERDNERAAARMRSRRQEVEALIPADSDDFELMRSWKDMGVMDQFMGVLGAKEKERPGGLGPNEIKALLSEFEGTSRKNVSAQIGQLAKTKWFRNMVTELLKSGSQDTTAHQRAPSDDSSPPQTPEAETGYERRNMPLRGRVTESLREQAKREALRRRGLV